MPTSLELVSKFLSENQRLEVAQSLAHDIDNRENAAVLADLIALVDSTIIDKIYPQLLEFSRNASFSDDSAKRDLAIRFVARSPRLCNDILTVLLRELNQGITTHFRFVTGYSNYVEKVQNTDGNEASKEEILNLFEFLSLLYTKVDIPMSDVASAIDTLLCLFLGHKDDDISASCSKLIRWRVKSIIEVCKTDDTRAKYLWDIIFNLIDTGKSKRHQANAFIMWLRTLNSDTEGFRTDDYFQQNIISQVFYWEVLQGGLVSNSHEIRKFCLSILQLSLKSISTTINTSILTWDTSNDKRLLAEWSRYTTLFEILGIDTSLHQTQAAVNDILALISKDSLIHPSWGFCLLSTGFQASMDSVRKYSLQILLSIEDQNLQLIRHALPFLENTFLPYMMLSRHFAVRPVSSLSNELQCVYGEKFSNFLCHVMTSLETIEDTQEVAFSILRVLESFRESFDAVRIYTTMGLVKGLQAKRILQFGKHDKLVLRLFDNFSEGELYKTTVQTLNLKLLLHFKLESLDQFAEIMSQFNSFNGYSIFSDHIEEVARYTLDSGFSKKDLIEYCQDASSDDAKTIFIWIATSTVYGFDDLVSEFLESQPDAFVASLLQRGFNVGEFSSHLRTRVETLTELATNSELDRELYSLLSQCNIDYNQICSVKSSVSELYMSIVTDVQSEDYGVLSSSYSKFLFLNNYVVAFGPGDLELDVEKLAKLKKILFCNSSNCSKTVTDFYKLKDAILGEFHRLLASYVVSSDITEGDFLPLLELLNFGSTHFFTLHSIGVILKEVFNRRLLSDNILDKAIMGLSESIDELNSERFKLSDKELHSLLIEVMLHPFVLESAIRIASINAAIASFCKAILVNSQGRRGLFTRLTKALSDFQISNTVAFEQLPFIPNFLIRACTHRQLQHSAFRLEIVVGKLYDDELSPHASSIYQAVNGVDEAAGKVVTYAILNSIRTPACAQAVVDEIFSEDDEFKLFHIIKTTDGVEEFTRVQLMKTILSVVDKVDVDYAIEKYLRNYVYLVENDPSPLVRVYTEWLIANLLLKKPDESEEFFNRLIPSLTREMKPTLVTIYERILYLMIQSMEKEEEIKYLTKLITIIIPAASTNKATTRHFSMSLATSVYQEIRNKQLVLEPSVNDIVDNMYQSALASDAFGQYRSGDALLWDIVKDLDLVNISGGLLLRLFDREVEFLTQDEFTNYLTPPQIKMLTHPIGNNRHELWVSELKTDRNRVAALQESSDVSQSPLQTKSGAWSTVMDVDEGGPEVIRSELIVVASLVDKPPNLGGICRLCDVLGAGVLTLHDMKIKNHHQFKSVAVTADYWMPMIEVKPESIVDYLREQKANGYTLIGLEQTDKSVVLNDQLKFPKKSLILLGREKEGIPGELLAELDLCVEINQVGVIRSMNIQTATAVIVHAYSTQHC